MKDFKINENEVLSVPTSINEISSEFLLGVSSNLNIADDYALIALVYSETIPMVISSNSKRKDITTAVLPLFVKSGHSYDDFINSIPVKAVININGSDISLGNHINFAENNISIGAVINAITKDKDLAKSILFMKEKVCFVEFKLVPTCAIKGATWGNNTYVSPYIKQSNNKVDDKREN